MGIGNTVGVAIRTEQKYIPKELPAYESEGAAGMDLKADIEHTMLIGPGERYAIPTGIRVAIPLGYEIQIRPRSGLAINKGLSVLNTPGTIDSDYRGEIKVILVNHGHNNILLEAGTRIAQMVLSKVPQITWLDVTESPVADFENTRRGVGGFGSTGT